MEINIISSTVQEYNGVRYSLCGNYFQNSRLDGEKRLHRIVYINHYGKIPKGFHIHHKDHDVSNNEIDNLELVSSRKHSLLHWESKTNKQKQVFIDNIPKGVEAAKKWHKSETGSKWHKEHYENMKDKLYKRDILKCTECGEIFEGIIRNKESKNIFCSRNCKSKHRRDSGVDNENRVCEYCKEVFSINKYSKSKFCSRSCSKKSSWELKKEKEIL